MNELFNSLCNKAKEHIRMGKNNLIDWFDWKDKLIYSATCALATLIGTAIHFFSM